jgi:phosphatidylglycerophosphate synthase
MFDAAILPLQRRLLSAACRGAGPARRAGRPDHRRRAGDRAAGRGAAALGLYALALVGLVLNRLADGLDGAVARLTEPTDRGAYLDIALDFVFYAAFPLGFAVAAPEANALPAAVLLASFVLSGTSFLAFSIIADRRGLTARDYPSKGIYYLGGLTEGAETIAFFAAFCLFPAAFPVLALIFAAGAAITGATRYAAAWQLFGRDR